ncbi:MAG: acetyl-CoA carboxylase carboxyltransferase subunit beta [Alphaproteobacteria bacterium]|nr:MAG: acetyl-CoA carboxylase carboxyltransferase subunit beta [Alphaproteobacteria bacterium]
MNWFTKLRPKLRFLAKRETPENLWHKCRGCGQMIFHREFSAALFVCPGCGFHERIGAGQRFEMLFDDAAYTPVSVASAPDDPLKFKDQKKYSDRLREARAQTGARDACAVAVGKLDGLEVVVGVQDFAFMAGSMGVGVGSAFVKAATEAVARRAPLIMFTAAGGARMQEGILSLMQMPRTTVAVSRLRAAGVPYIVVLCDPTTGGVTASYAMLGDVQIAEPGALIGFAGARVIENTIRERLPEGFQRAEYLLEHGMLDMVVPRAELRATLARLVALLTNTQGGVKKPRPKALAAPAD